MRVVAASWTLLCLSNRATDANISEHTTQWHSRCLQGKTRQKLAYRELAGTFSVDACRGSAARETTWPCSLISRPCSSRRSGAGRKAFGFAGGAPGSPGCPGIPGIAGTLPKPGTAGRPAKFCVSAAAACCAAASTAGCAPAEGAAGAACAAYCVGNPCTSSISSSRTRQAEQAIVTAKKWCLEIPASSHRQGPV